MIVDYTLTDLISREKLQTILDAFAEANQVAATITDIHGVPITKRSNHSEVCKLVRDSPKGLANCIRSGERLGQEAARRMEPFYMQCLSCGFSDAAVPIIVEGRHLGNWLIGQYHVGEVDEAHLRRYAREIEAYEDKMAQAFRDMPKLSTQQFEKILSLFWLIGNEISAMGYQNLMQQRQAEKFEMMQAELEQHKARLEEMVEQRTAELVMTNDHLEREIRRTKRVQDEQSKLLTAIENVDEGIIITDTTPTILYVNPSYLKFTGYEAEELHGRNPSVLQSGYHSRKFYQEFWQTLQRGETWRGRFKNKRKDGTLYEEDTTVSVVKDSAGEIINYIAVKRDMAKELELERQLQQMSKLEAIGTLAAGIAHEINTPVQYVSDNNRFLEEVLEDYGVLLTRYNDFAQQAAKAGNFLDELAEIERIKEEVDLNFLMEESGKAVSSSLDGLERIATIVRAMKEFAHPGGKDKRLENINDLIENTVEVSRNEWKYVADIVLDLDRALPPLPVLAGQLKQVILNLIINGAQAIGAGNEKSSGNKGTIRIATSHQEENVIIKVTDDGCGIDENVIDRIFDPFFTTKSVGRGTGQGLSLAYNTIVEGHGGTLDVASELGCGTEFTITLPKNAEEGGM